MTCRSGGAFVAAILVVTFLISLVAPRSIFQLGVWSFTGFAGLLPLVIAALFWRRSTKAGAIAAVLTVIGLWSLLFADGFAVPGYSLAGTGVMPVAAVLAASSLVLVVVSSLTAPPSEAVVERFFPRGRR